jgi:hypothetical protein
MPFFIDSEKKFIKLSKLPQKSHPIFCFRSQIVSDISYREPGKKTEVFGVKCTRSDCQRRCSLAEFFQV